MNQDHATDASTEPGFGARSIAQRADGPAMQRKTDAAIGIVATSHNETEARLVNWGRWCNSGKSVGHCGSIEWQWQARWKGENGWKDEPSAAKILDRIDSLDAERVQSIMQYLPNTYRAVLSLKYVKRETPKRIAYKANCREWELESLLFEVLQAVAKCLTGRRN